MEWIGLIFFLLIAAAGYLLVSGRWRDIRDYIKYRR